MHFIHEGIGCSEDHAIEVARARYEEKKLEGHRKRAGRTVESPIVLSDEGVGIRMTLPDSVSSSL